MGSQNRETKEFFSKECGKHTIPTLASLHIAGEYNLETVPLVPVSQLDLIKPGEMYIKRVFKPLFVSSFVRSYHAAEIGIYKNFGGGFRDALPYCDKGFDSPEFLFVPAIESKQAKKDDIFDW